MGRLTSDHELLYNSGPAINPLDSEEFRRQATCMIIDLIADYYKNVDKYPVRSQVEPGYLRKRLPESAPYNPESMETILQDVQEHIVPGIARWQSPNYFAYFPSSGSNAGFLGEMLSSGFNVVGFKWMLSPAATELENIVMDWLGQMLKLPKSFLFSGNGGGVMQGTTCEAILCTLAAARDRVLNKIGRENISKLVGYGSDQTHCALQKAAQIVGIDLKNFRAIKTTKSSSYGLSADSLLPQINLDVEAGLIPLFVCATIDPIKTKYENCNHDTFLELSEEEQTNAFNRALLEMVNASGKVYMTHAFVDGIYAIRFAAGATLTEERHVMVAWTVVQAHVDATLTIPRD